MLHAVAATLLAGSVAAAEVKFVAPREGGQAIGLQLIEVETDVTGVDRVDFHVDGVLAGVARKPPYRIAFDFGTSIESRKLAATVWSDAFRTSTTTALQTAALTANESVHVDVVEVPLRIRSSRALSPTDIRIRENGVEQKIRDLRRDRPAAHFAFIVDRSLSMNEGKLDAAVAAVDAATSHLRPGDTASVVFFNHVVGKPRPLARGAAASRADVSASGGTSLRDAIASVASSDRTYALVITDGGDRNSVLTDEEALRRISGTKTVVNALVLGASHTRFLDRAAHNTGGSVVSASTTSVAAHLARMMQDINSRYLAVYQSEGTARGWRRIDVRPGKRGVQIVSARRGYFAE